MSKIPTIFGASGFIGSHLFEIYKGRAIAPDRAERIAETNDIIYLISTIDNYNVFDAPFLDVDTNLTVLIEHLQHLKPGQTFNYISSWFVYGNDIDLPAKESYSCNPKGFYSATKLCAEHLVESYCTTMGIDYRIIRLCNVYGHGDKPSKQKNALQYLINELRENNPIKLYNCGEFFRDYMHVTDICRAIKLVVDKAPKNDIINIGSGEALLFKDLIALAKRQLKVTTKVENMEPPEFHKAVQVEDFYMDISKLKALGFKQKIKIEQGIRELCR